MSHASNALTNDDFAMEMEDFGKLFEESIKAGNQKEGSVVTGVVISIEKDVVIVDVGLKSEGRIPLREFQVGNAAPELKPGDEVEVYLERIENRARAQGLKTLFVLTTRTAHWFRERGFEPSGVERLPAARASLYNYQRNSKIFEKTL